MIVVVVDDDSPTQIEVGAGCSTCWVGIVGSFEIVDPSIAVDGSRALRSSYSSMKHSLRFLDNLVEDEEDRHGDVGAQCHYNTHHTSMAVEADARSEDEAHVAVHNEDDRAVDEVAEVDDTQEGNAGEGKVADSRTTSVEAGTEGNIVEVVGTSAVALGVAVAVVEEGRCH